MEFYLGTICPFGFNFAMRQWAFCNGELLPINSNQALFSLLGTMYGGDGRTSFGLPDLRGRSMVHKDTTNVQGRLGGAETHTLSVDEMPAHNHKLWAEGAIGNKSNPNNKLIATATADAYGAAAALVGLAPAAIVNTGSGGKFNIRNPYNTLNFCICVQGLFPSRS